MNIADVKKELSGDEKVLESAFKLETLYKKYKMIIWAVVIGLILFFVAKSVMQGMQEAKLNEANSAYLTLEKNPDDSKALAILKEKNPALFELFSYAQAIKKEDTAALEVFKNSSNSVVADASSYAVSVLNKSPKDSVLYKEMAILQEAYVAIKSGDIESAKEKLALIDEKSQLYNIASLLNHSTIKAK